MMCTVGIDVGSNSVKTVVMSFDDNGLNEKHLVSDLSKIRKRNIKDVIVTSFEQALSKANVAEEDIVYIATTGEGEMVDFRHGHFWSMTAHARGALFLNTEARAVVDAGALHTKAFTMDSRSKVLDHKISSQCASGSGQFLENISRYLGIPLEEIGDMSLTADSPEVVSSICAVLAETDVINMVSRGISPNNILKGIHLSMGHRLINLLRGLELSGPVMITGGLAANKGFIATIQELMDKEKMNVPICTHNDSVFAGAIGAALWGAFRHLKLKDRGISPVTHLKSEYPLGPVTKNIGSMILNNLDNYSSKHAFAERDGEAYKYWSWVELADDIFAFSSYLKKQGLQKGDRIALITYNSYQRLVTEIAIMASGLVSVPIFAGYGVELMSELLEFSDVEMLIIDCVPKFDQLKFKNKPTIILNNPLLKSDITEITCKESVSTYNDVVGHVVSPEEKDEIKKAFLAVEPSDTLLIMYTSGTTSFPKGVMLSHYNIMSQQSALQTLWKPEHGMRFLCYLPWHHSFGGLFERFFALHSGGCLAIDDSFGKNVDKLFENFSEIKPHIYFSVPKIYQEIVSRTLVSKEAEEIFFHDDLKFVFTSAAKLPLSISNIFKKKNIPVVEGWGLTETSPCCTLTKLLLERKQGIVGRPISGVEVKLGEENEILVKGPNIMKGYFRLPEETSRVLGEDGWFKTGDIGEITHEEVKIVSRKDRVFKLDNGEKVFPAPIEEKLRSCCKFIKHAYIFSSGGDHPFILIFPNNELFKTRNKSSLDETDCSYPNTVKQFSECLLKCVNKVNSTLDIKYERIAKAVVIDRELSLERNELTPSFKLVPRNVETNYRTYMDCLIKNRPDKLPSDAFVVNIFD